MLKLIEMKFKDGQLEGYCPRCNTYHSISTKRMIQKPLQCLRVHCDCGSNLKVYFGKGYGELFLALIKDLPTYTDKFNDADVENFNVVLTRMTWHNSTMRIKKLVHNLNLGDMRV